MKKVRFVCLVGARPNFVKIEPIYRAFGQYPEVEVLLVHTGQHSSSLMSDVFFQDLQIPTPNYHLNITAKKPHRQIAQIIARFGDILQKTKPNAVILVGDVNSTLAGALAANKTGFPIAHIEAGLRSHNCDMPEESNRILTDHLATWLFTTEPIARENLIRENIAPEKIHFVGNVMVDALLHHLEKIRENRYISSIGAEPKSYVLCTIHRNFTIHAKEKLGKIIRVLQGISLTQRVVFPVHPHTSVFIRKFGLQKMLDDSPNIMVVPPLGYLDFCNLMENAALVITDSGGIQEETTALGVPCMTYRPDTERPITVQKGSNTLFYHEAQTDIVQKALEKLNTEAQQLYAIPEFWDGKAAERIAAILINGEP